MPDQFKGYKGKSLELLKSFSIPVWSEVSINSKRGNFKGIVLPRSENDDDCHIVLKLASGYNIGIAIDTIVDIKEYGYKEAHYKIPRKSVM